MTIIEKIKLLFAVRKPAGELIEEVKTIKSAWKSWGFWASVLGSLLALVAGLQGLLPVTTALIITTSLTILYNIIRAIQNAGTPGVSPIFTSSRFWVGVLGIVSAGLVQLQTGGVNPAWISTAIAIIGAVMAGAQSLGAQQPPETK